MKEAKFQEQVTQLANLNGWSVVLFNRVLVRRPNGSTYWVTPFGADGKGFPDLLMTRGSRLLAAELKIGKNKCTPEQLVWLDRLAVTGAETYVWKPDCWAEIERVLA